MILILFNKKSEESIPQVSSEDYVIHAHPACESFNSITADEYYLDGYGTANEGLKKITMDDIVKSMQLHKRIDML